MSEEEANAIAERLTTLHWWYADKPMLWEDYEIVGKAQKCATELVAASGYHLVFIVQPDFCGYRATNKKGL